MEAQPTSYKQVIKVVVGQNVNIPCSLKQLGGNILLWKKQGRVLFAGELRVRRNSRFQVFNNNLVIQESNIDDSGEYVCEIERDGGDLEAISMYLKVLQPATAEVTIGSHLTVKTETSLAVSCSGSGVPPPKVRWRRGNMGISSGTAQAQLVLESVTKEDIGEYVCEAFNGVGEPDTETLKLDILYPPEGVLLKPDISFQPKCGMELQCLVHSSSPPTIHWFHNDLLLHPVDGVTMWSLDNLHVLQIHSCDQNILGQFTCKAENNLGSSEESIRVYQEFVESKIEEFVSMEELTNNVRRNVNQEALPLVSSDSKLLLSSTLFILLALLFL